MKYLESGYIDARYLLSQKWIFNFLIAGRAVGKTYGFMTELCKQNELFLLVRRTQVQLDIISKPELSPFSVLNTDFGWNIEPKKFSKYIVNFADDNDDLKACGVALSTFSNVRGFDASKITHIIFDEFIPETRDIVCKREADAFFNLYETVNRNRELKGQQAVKVWFLANSNNINSGILEYLGLIDRLDSMINSGVEDYYDARRSIALHVTGSTPISRMKRKTALYSLTEGTAFSEMSLDNGFKYDRTGVKSLSLREFKPVVSVGDLCVYRHKSKSFYYVTEVLQECEHFTESRTDIIAFKRKYVYLLSAIYNRRIFYEKISYKKHFLSCILANGDV